MNALFIQQRGKKQTRVFAQNQIYSEYPSVIFVKNEVAPTGALSAFLNLRVWSHC